MNQSETKMNTWLICVRDRTHSCVVWLVHTWHDSFVYVTHSCTWHDHGTSEERSRSVELLCAWMERRWISHSTQWVCHVKHLNSVMTFEFSHVTDRNESCRTCECVMSRIWMKHCTLHLQRKVPVCWHLAQVKEDEDKWVVAHIWMSHGTHMIWMSHVSHMNESCLTYEWVMSHIWIHHVSHMDESCHTDEWVMSHRWMSHVSQMNESWHTYE